MLLKLDRKFDHPSGEVMKGLLKKVNCDNKETQKIIATIHGSNSICKKFSMTPVRLVASLSAAIEFNHVLIIVLKEVNVQKLRYILHMRDARCKHKDEHYLVYQRKNQKQLLIK